MKKYVALLVLFMVLGSCVCASASEENLPVKGTKQLMFGFSGCHLNEYRGGIGFRYYLREKTVLRFGLDVNWSSARTPLPFLLECSTIYRLGHVRVV